MASKKDHARKVDQRGRISLPYQICKKMGIEPNDTVQITENQESVLITKIASKEESNA